MGKRRKEKKENRVIKRLEKKGWEISYHSYNHNRFDQLSFQEKKEDFEKGLNIFKKFNITPKGFIAPQHSISKDIFDILKKNNFRLVSPLPLPYKKRGGREYVIIVRGGSVARWFALQGGKYSSRPYQPLRLWNHGVWFYSTVPLAAISNPNNLIF